MKRASKNLILSMLFLLSGLYFSRKISFLSLKFKLVVLVLQKLRLSTNSLDSSGLELITSIGFLNNWIIEEIIKA